MNRCSAILLGSLAATLTLPAAVPVSEAMEDVRSDIRIATEQLADQRRTIAGARAALLKQLREREEATAALCRDHRAGWEA